MKFQPFAALRKADGALTIVVVNKKLSEGTIRVLRCRST
jgi:hypothetical protein